MKRLCVMLSLVPLGCGDIPALDQAVSPAAERADYPALVPLDGILDTTGDRIAGPDLEASLDRRLAALRARAAALRGPVMTETDKARLEVDIDS